MSLRLKMTCFASFFLEMNCPYTRRSSNKKNFFNLGALRQILVSEPSKINRRLSRVRSYTSEEKETGVRQGQGQG